MIKYDKTYWDKRFMTRDIPDKVKTAIKRIYNSYPVECLPQGLADPMYIMNIICLELGVGDGKGNFYLEGGQS
jgi:hypothetical protein